jgi:RimJ/RimL family protein N-acetyltransferase
LEDTDLNDDRWFDRWLYPELFGQKPALILMLNRMGVASVHNLYRGSGQFQILLWDKALLGKPEVGKQVIDKIFSYKLRRLEAAIPTFNRLSIRYAARLGFRKVGYISEDYLRDGRWYDVLLFELLAKDFRR